MGTVAENLEAVESRIAVAARRAGRDPAGVTLVAVSKLIPVERVREGIAAGLRVLGENYVQEARTKIAELGRGVAWHLVGHLQANKAKHAVELFDLIHSLDSVELALELDRQAERRGRAEVPVLVQLSLAGEATKSGVSEQALLPLLKAIVPLRHVSVQGLMTMPPYVEDPEASRPFFRALRELRERVEKEGIERVTMAHLSMGMSHDFEVAIEEGATLIRVGTAIFGPRPA